MNAHVFGVDDMWGDGQVAANADMVLPADVHGVLDVPDEVVRRGLPAHGQEGHEVDADHPALVGHSPEKIVGLAAGPVGNRAATRMADGDRLRGVLDRVHRRLQPAVGGIDRDPPRVQLLYQLPA